MPYRHRSYRRNLPHLVPEHASIFLTWRLRGTLPPHFRLPIQKVPSLTDGERFARIDRELDRGQRGPLWLRDSRIAEIVCMAIEFGSESQLDRFVLHEYVVMPNHVHILLTPNDELWRITKGIKGASAREANQVLGRVGQEFWQDESYDRATRNVTEFDNVRQYIAANPVRATLCANPEEWPWSSLSRRNKAVPTGSIAQPAPD